jgi:hypothetical protein
MSDASETRVSLSRDGSDLVLSCDGCGSRQPLDAAAPVAEQLLGFLDEHQHSG